MYLYKSSGAISSDGLSAFGSGYAGGGAGGSVWITTDVLTGNGLISAQGIYLHMYIYMIYMNIYIHIYDRCLD
jgi:hypothetical protein